MAVAETFEEFKEVINQLNASGEITLAVSVEINARKGILLSAASEFEHLLCEVVRSFALKASGEDARIVSIIEKKAISRQYHTWFDWKNKSANSFYSLFGEEYTVTMKDMKKMDEEYSASVDAFLELGQLRNLLVHNNYAAFYIEKTYEELFETYKLACNFITTVERSLL